MSDRVQTTFNDLERIFGASQNGLRTLYNVSELHITGVGNERRLTRVWFKHPFAAHGSDEQRNREYTRWDCLHVATGKNATQDCYDYARWVVANHTSERIRIFNGHKIEDEISEDEWMVYWKACSKQPPKGSIKLTRGQVCCLARCKLLHGSGYQPGDSTIEDEFLRDMLRRKVVTTSGFGSYVMTELGQSIVTDYFEAERKRKARG